MTRLLTCGWETSDVNEAGISTINANSTLTVVNATPTPRAGGAWCIKESVTSGTALPGTYKTFSLPALKTDVWVRFAFYAHAVVNAVEVNVCGFYDNAATLQAHVTWGASDGLLRAYRSTSSILLATSSSGFAQDQWHLLEARWQATSTTVGIIEVWLDGTRVLNATSVDNTSSTVVGVQSIAIGSLVSVTSSSSTSTYIAFDDIAINDTSGTVNNGRCGDGRIVLLTPNGAGSTTALTRGGTDSGANWSQVDELPPSMTDYVYSATAATRDTYALTDLPAGVASISAVEVLALTQNSDAGAGSLGLTVKSGATTNEGSAQTLGTSAGYLRQLYEVDPNTSAAWTVSAVNALEAGVTVR